MRCGDKRWGRELEAASAGPGYQADRCWCTAKGTVPRAPLRRRFILARHARHSAQQLCHLRSSPQRLHHPSNNFRYFLFLS